MSYKLDQRDFASSRLLTVSECKIAWKQRRQLQIAPCFAYQYLLTVVGFVLLVHYVCKRMVHEQRCWDRWQHQVDPSPGATRLSFASRDIADRIDSEAPPKLPGRARGRRLSPGSRRNVSTHNHEKPAPPTTTCDTFLPGT